MKKSFTWVATLLAAMLVASGCNGASDEPTSSVEPSTEDTSAVSSSEVITSDVTSEDTSSEEVSSSEIVLANYVLVGENRFDLEARDPNPDIANMVAQYTATIAATKDAALSVYIADTLISNIGLDADANNNLTQGLVVRTAVERAELWIHAYNDGGYDAWLGGYVAPEPETMTITVKNVPAIQAEHWVVHAWNNAGSASSVDATLGEGQLTATILADRTGFLVAAYDGEFNWSNLKYKSEDIAIVQGTLEYTLADLVTDKDYYLCGTFNEWQTSGDEYKFVVDEADENHYVIASVHLEEGAKFGVKSTTGDWYSNGQDYEITKTSDYKIDFYIQAKDGIHIIVTDLEVVTEPVYAVKLNNNEPITLDKKTQSGSEVYVEELEVSEGDSITILKDGAKEDKAFAKAGDETNKNNAYASEKNAILVHNNAKTELYYEMETGAIWLGGYKEEIHEPVYKVKLGDAKPIELQVNEGNKDELCATGLTVTAGMVVEILMDDAPYSKAFAKKYSGNNLVNETIASGEGTTTSVMKVVDSAENVGLYMDMNPNSQDFGGIWLNGYVTKFYLFGNFNKWTFDDNYKFTTTEDENHFVIDRLELGAGEEFGVKASAPVNGVDWFVNGEANAKVEKAGYYKINFYLRAENGIHIVPDLIEEIVDSYTVKIGAAETAVTLAPQEDNANQVYVDGLTLTKDETLVFYKNGTEIQRVAVWADASEDNKNNAYLDEGGAIKVRTTTDEKAAGIYYNFVDNGVWVSGYKEPAPQPDKYVAKIGEAEYELAKDDENQYFAEVTSVKAGDEVVILKNGEATEFSADTYETNNIETKEGKLLVRQDATNVKIYYKANHQVWLDGYIVPIPTEDVYTAQIGRTTVELAKNEAGDEYSAVVASVTAGDEVVILKNGKATTFTADTWATNNVMEAEGKLVVRQDAVNVHIYYKADNSVWLEGFVGFFITGSFNEWGNPVVMTKDAEVEGHYYIESFEFAAEAQFKVIDQSNTYYGEEGTGDKPNVVIHDAGVYRIDFYAEGLEGKYIVVTPVKPVVNDVVDVLNKDVFGTNGTSYKNYTSNNNVKGSYSALCAGDKNSIQLRTTNSNSGVIGHYEGYVVKSVKLHFVADTANGRTLDFYSSANEFAITDMYGSSMTKIGSLTKAADNGVLELTFAEANQLAYFGFRSNSGAMYIDYIEITWTAAK